MSSSSVNVEVDAAPQQDLSQVLSEIRSQYEGIAEKNRREMDAWYKVKVRHVDKLIVSLFLQPEMFANFHLSLFPRPV